jgi:Nucleotide-binding protein implicated in inhibition of septum formation
VIEQSLDNLILASSSERRVALLKQINIKPGLVLPADTDESPLKKELPKDYSIRMAKSKPRKYKVQIQITLCLVLIQLLLVVEGYCSKLKTLSKQKNAFACYQEEGIEYTLVCVY